MAIADLRNSTSPCVLYEPLDNFRATVRVTMLRRWGVNEDDEIDRSIVEHGWHAIAVEDHEPPFLYTIGLITQSNHPELIILGLDRRTAHSVVAAVVENIRAGTRVGVDMGAESRLTILDNLTVAFRPMHPTQHELFLGYALAHARRHATPLRAVQVLWPDKADRFPVDVDCDIDVRTLQPRLELPATLSELREFRRNFASD